MAKRTFMITFNDHTLGDKTQEALQRSIYVAVEEYLIYSGRRQEGITTEEMEASLNLRVLEDKIKKRTD